MKLEYLLAVVVLLLMGASAFAEAPPACVGDQCDAASVEAAKSAPQHSIVRSRSYATQFGANHPIATAPLRAVGKTAKAVAKVALPPYPRARKVASRIWFPGKLLLRRARGC